MSIYLSHYPGKTQELLKYISVILDAAAKFPNYAWRYYDEQFRVRRAERVQNWGKINSDLWLRAMSVSSTTFSYQPDVYQFGSAMFTVVATNTHAICVAALSMVC